MIRTLVYSLLAIEAALCVALWLRRRHQWPILAYAMLAAAVVYGYLGYVRWFAGPFAYRDAVDATRWIFTVTTSAVCVQAVAVMVAGINGYRMFAAASSLVFAVVAGAAVMSIGQAIHAWAVGCVLYLAANHWMYSRVALPDDARRFAAIAMLLVAGNAVALAMLEYGRGDAFAETAGLILQRMAPIAALVQWLKTPKAPAVTPGPQQHHT